MLPLLLVLPYVYQSDIQAANNSRQLTMYPTTEPQQSFQQKPGLTYITLTYQQAKEDGNIEHNCHKIMDSAEAMHNRFIIYTDNVNASYCKACECRRFRPFQCPCAAGDGQCAHRNPCEKLLFIVEMARTFQEFVLMDNDLIIMRDELFTHLYARSRTHDFLASYGHDMSVRPTYNRDFNSGLFFMRRLPGLDYGIMARAMYGKKARKDQSIVSWFVQKHYRNWDTLSYKWHCRSVIKGMQGIPPQHCYTIHDRAEVQQMLNQLNASRLKLRI